LKGTATSTDRNKLMVGALVRDRAQCPLTSLMRLSTGLSEVKRRVP
jgi:hypothetical protein